MEFALIIVAIGVAVALVNGGFPKIVINKTYTCDHCREKREKTNGN